MKTTTSKSGGFAEIRRSLLKLRKPQLINLIGELHRMSKENQRFLEARLGNPPKAASCVIGTSLQTVCTPMFLARIQMYGSSRRNVRSANTSARPASRPER